MNVKSLDRSFKNQSSETKHGTARGWKAGGRGKEDE